MNNADHITVFEEAERGKGHRSGLRAWKAMLWCEWFAQSRLLLGCLAAWLALVWTLPLYTQPGWILLFGALYAAIAGPLYGGGDLLESSEEFTFSLPPDRGQRWGARLVIGGGSMLVFALLDLLILGLDLPQFLARLYVDAGLISDRPLEHVGFLSGLTLIVPITVFSLGFSIACLSRSRAGVMASPLWAVVGCLVLLRLGLSYERLRWEVWNGWFSQPLMAVLSMVSLIVSQRLYRSKEIGRHYGRITIPSHWWIWILLFAIGALVTVFVTQSLIADFGSMLR